MNDATTPATGGTETDRIMAHNKGIRVAWVAAEKVTADAMSGGV